MVAGFCGIKPLVRLTFSLTFRQFCTRRLNGPEAARNDAVSAPEVLGCGTNHGYLSPYATERQPTHRVVHKNALWPSTINLELPRAASHYVDLCDRTRRRGSIRRPRTGQRDRGVVSCSSRQCTGNAPGSVMLHEFVSVKPAPRRFFHLRSRPYATLAQVLHGVAHPSLEPIRPWVILPWGGVASPC